MFDHTKFNVWSFGKISMADYGCKPIIHHINMVLRPMADIIGAAAYGS